MLRKFDKSGDILCKQSIISDKQTQVNCQRPLLNEVMLPGVFCLIIYKRLSCLVKPFSAHNVVA